VLGVYNFNQISATNEIEAAAGFLSGKQVEEIRGIYEEWI